jgi:4-amino-4-deoxy-L-arabinose transferase-like glycosyltransferase
MTKIKSLFGSIYGWIKENPIESALLILILVLGAFLRVYRIADYMTFLGDEGRDVLVVRRLLINGDLIFVGPGTSVGNMYLGPLYYYMMAPALWLANFSPVGPAVEVAVLGTVTIFFIWFVSQKWFGKIAAIVAAFFYSVSPVVIYHSRSSWNPNIMPFFALLVVYSLWKVWNEKKWSWIVVSGISFAFVVQSHYLGLILLPFMFIFFILSVIRDWRQKALQKNILVSSIISFGSFLTLMSSLLIFDARYGWRNALAMKDFFLQRSDVSFNLVRSANKLWSIFLQLVTRLLAGTNALYGKYAFIGIIALLIFAFAIKKELKEVSRKAFVFIGVWLMVGLIGLSLYKQELYDHYFGFLFPAPFILMGGLVSVLVNYKDKLLVILLAISLGFLVYINILNNAFWREPNRQLARTIEIADKINEEAEGKKFNLAVIAEQNYEGAYQYFLEASSAPILFIDPQRYSETVADQLFVVCEYEDREKCQPTSNPKAEVANFGWSKVEKSWEVGGVVLFKLIHNR